MSEHLTLQNQPLVKVWPDEAEVDLPSSSSIKDEFNESVDNEAVAYDKQELANADVDIAHHKEEQEVQPAKITLEEDAAIRRKTFETFFLSSQVAYRWPNDKPHPKSTPEVIKPVPP